MIEIGNKFGGGRGCARASGLVRGISLPVGVGSGEEAVPPPQKFLDFCLKMAHFGCIFLPYAIFFAVQRGGMAQVAHVKYAPGNTSFAPHAANSVHR